MEADFISLVSSAPAVSALVGDRVRPVSRQQGEGLPSITIARVSGGPEYADDGEVGLERARIQVDCWAETYTAADAVAAAVRDVLSAYEGLQGSTYFSYITLEDRRDLREGGGGVPEYLFHIALDFIVWVRG